MPSTVTVTRTTTSSSNTHKVINIGYLKAWSGILKLLQLILGCICVVIVAYYWKNTIYYSNELFFLNMVVCFMIGTSILLLSCLVSLSTEGIISKTIFVSFISFQYIKLQSICFIIGSFISHYCWSTSFDSVISFHIES